MLACMTVRLLERICYLYTIRPILPSRFLGPSRVVVCVGHSVIGSPPAHVLLLGSWHVNIYITYVDKPTKGLFDYSQYTWIG
jgi:hypothetical protein